MLDIRKRIVAEAHSWEGTPWQHFQCCKQVGVDCAHLIIGIGKAVSVLPEDFQVPYYSPQWFVNTENPTLLVDTLYHFNFRSKPLESQLPGDIIVFRIGKKLCHVGLLLEDDMFIHARASRTQSKVLIVRYCTPWRDKFATLCFAFPGVGDY